MLSLGGVYGPHDVVERVVALADELGDLGLLRREERWVRLRGLQLLTKTTTGHKQRRYTSQL